jgi:hypothetical protein
VVHEGIQRRIYLRNNCYYSIEKHIFNPPDCQDAEHHVIQNNNSYCQSSLWVWHVVSYFVERSRIETFESNIPRKISDPCKEEISEKL